MNKFILKHIKIIFVWFCTTLGLFKVYSWRCAIGSLFSGVQGVSWIKSRSDTCIVSTYLMYYLLGPIKTILRPMQSVSIWYQYPTF